MLLVIATTLLESIALLAAAARLLADKAIADFTVCADNLAAPLAQNPVLITALNPIIGYQKAAAIAGRAYQEGRLILEVAVEETNLSRRELKKLLDPAGLAHGGTQKKAGNLGQKAAPGAN